MSEPTSSADTEPSFYRIPETGWPAATADLAVAVVAMGVSYAIRFSRADVWVFLSDAFPVLVLLIAVQSLTAARLGMYRSGQSAGPLIGGAAAALLVGFGLAQLNLAQGVSRLALIAQALLYVCGAVAWRRIARSDEPHTGELVIEHRVRAMLPGAIVGLVLACLALDPGFVLGTGRFWERPEHDFNAYLVAWQYFLHDTWRWPLLDLPEMGYPEGGSVLFNDGLPIGVIPSKVIYQLAGVMVNPFGFWIFTTYVLLGGFTSRLVHACGVKAWWAGSAAAFLVICKAVFMWRLGHVAISGHFLIMWALCLYIEDVRTLRFSAMRHFVLGAVSILSNAYLVVMVAMIQGATVLTLLARARFTAKDLARSFALVLGVATIALIEGYGAMFESGPMSMRAGGFGVFSWNVASLVVPPDFLWGPTGIVREATGGHYEGDAYLGAGTILLVLSVALLTPRRCLEQIRSHWILVAVIFAAMVFAGSNRLFIGSHLVYDVALPDRLLDAAALFRASGRFIWPAVYAASVFAVIGCLLWFPRSTAALILFVAVAVQASEMPVLVRGVRNLTEWEPPYIVDDEQFSTWMSDHDRVFQWPSYSCGALVPNTPWGGEGANRELRLQLLAARLGIPSNSIYSSRQLKDCAAEAKWAAEPRFEPGVLHLIGKVRALESSVLSALISGGHCVDAGYAFVCSLDELRDDSDAASPLHLQPMAVSVCNGQAPAATVSWRSASGQPVQIRVGRMGGELAGAGASGQRELTHAAGTNLFLVPGPEDQSAVDIETVYHRPTNCVEPIESARGPQ